MADDRRVDILVMPSAGTLKRAGAGRRLTSMRKHFIGGAAVFTALATIAGASALTLEGAAVASLYELSTTSLTGKPVDLKTYEGKVTLVVNVASKCGFTPQYAGLQQLHDELAPKGFSVLGFPSNDFGGQEPGSAEEIATFCELNYGVKFPMFSKQVTKAGADQSPIYGFLGTSGHLPGWNFSKYVIGKDGTVKAFFSSKVTPDAAELRQAILTALAE